MFTGAFMGLAYLVASSDALSIFNYFVQSVTVFGSLTWVCCFFFDRCSFVDV